jgi:hypothetical protein
MENEAVTRSSQTKADELEERLINFGVRIIRLTVNLPKTPAGRHIAESFAGFSDHHSKQLAPISGDS